MKGTKIAARVIIRTAEYALAIGFVHHLIGSWLWSAAGVLGICGLLMPFVDDKEKG